MPASNMDGQRKWKFVADGNTISLVGTDFWIDHQTELVGAGSDQIPKIVLNEIWEHADLTITAGRARRKYVEDRIKAIAAFLGKQGTLTIDEGYAEAQVYTSISLLAIAPIQQSNELFEYTLEFGYPQASGGGGGSGIMLASRLEFGTESDEDLVLINSKNMVLELGGDGDKTVFKEIFRAAPIRVQGSLPLKLINVTGIIDKNLPSFWSMAADTNDGADYRANKLLDPTGTKYWRSTNTALPHWIKGYRGDFPLFKPARFGIIPQTPTAAPKDFILEGSDNGSSWTTVATYTSIGSWVSGVEKTFDVTSANWKYFRITASALDGGGNQMEIKEFKLYPYSTAVLDDFHSSNHGKRFLVEDRVRMLRWLHLGRERQLRINNDSLLGSTQLLAHLRDVQPSDVAGLETTAYNLSFAYGYGS